MNNTKEVVLETKELEKHFGGIKAVDGINMKLYRNEILGIVGDNGAGKSSLIKSITGVYKKDGGSIFIDGQEVEINSSREAKMMGIEMRTITAVVIGGTIVGGGRALMSGTLIGVFILAVLENGLGLSGMHFYLQQVIIGILFITVVALRSRRQTQG